MLATIANKTNGEMKETHILEIPSCCPVSKNPRPGSKIIISYYPSGCSLEINALIAYLHSFKGGFRDATGQIVVRDMEDMIQRIAEDCSHLLQIDVEVEACLHLLPKQEMKLSVHKKIA